MNNSIKRFEIFRMLFAIVIALLVSFVLLFLLCDRPIDAIQTLITGPLNPKRHYAKFWQVIVVMIPLIFTGTGVSIMFSANRINLASDGAFHLGGLLATITVLEMGLPSSVSPIVALVLATVVGALFTMIPALLNIKTESSEMVSSLMLNYLALYFCMYILMHFICDPHVGSGSYKIADELQLHKILPFGKVHTGLIIAILVAVLGWVFLYKTKMGYQLRIAGQNEAFAKYSGINIVKVILISQLIGGAIAGLGGGVELLSPANASARFDWTELLGYGWDGILIATLAKNNPLYTPLAAFFLAYLRVGADSMQSAAGVPLEMVKVIEGVIILFAVAEQFLSGTKHKLIAKEAKKQEQKEAA